MSPETQPKPEKKKKKQNLAAVQKELRDLGRPDPAKPQAPQIDLKKLYVRAAAVVAVLWVVAFILPTWIPKAVMGALTILVVGVGIWLTRYAKKTQAIGALLQSADTDEGRQEALKRLGTEFKATDVQAQIARAQLEMQDDPKKALATLEGINLEKQLSPVADQIRSMRAMIHLTLGDTTEARALVDKMEVGKQQEAKTRAMFATVAGEAWGRTGQAKKAVELLELFNPEDPDFAEMRVQMWRARAFAHAGLSDMKGAVRALKKLSEINPQLLGMFVQGKKIHPLLQQEAKQLFMKSGYVPRKMVRQRM